MRVFIKYPLTPVPLLIQFVIVPSRRADTVFILDPLNMQMIHPKMDINMVHAKCNWCIGER